MSERWADSETLARLSAYPCLQCLSDKELWIGAAMILCRILETDPDADCTTETLTAHAACADCFSERQMWQILVATIATFAVDGGYVDNVTDLLQQGSCLNCLSEKKIKTIVVAILSRGIENGTLFPARP